MISAKLSGISIACKDLEVSYLFYTEILGLEVTDTREGHIFFPCLELYSLTRWTEGLGKKVMDYYYGGLTHSIVFETITFSSILDKIYRTDWVNVMSPVKKEKGLRVITVLDPDGNLVTIKEKFDNSAKVYNESEIDNSFAIAVNSSEVFYFDEKGRK